VAKPDKMIMIDKVEDKMIESPGNEYILWDNDLIIA
jgi:hypothetical protein